MEDFGEISNFPLPSTMLELIDMGFELVEELNDMLAETEPAFLEEIAYEMDEVVFLAPIPKPRKNIIGIGLNYTEHVAESARTLDTTGKLPQKPIIFSKPPTTVTATNTDIIKNTKNPNFTSCFKFWIFVIHNNTQEVLGSFYIRFL